MLKHLVELEYALQERTERMQKAEGRNVELERDNLKFKRRLNSMTAGKPKGLKILELEDGKFMIDERISKHIEDLEDLHYKACQNFLDVVKQRDELEERNRELHAVNRGLIKVCYGKQWGE